MTAAVHIRPLIERNTLPLSATAMNRICLVRFAWKWYSRGRVVLYVSMDLLIISFKITWCLFVLLGDGRWRQVIRRCASVADTGVTGVCNWGVYENGVYWEECYCSSDSCNAADSLVKPAVVLPLVLVLCALAFSSIFIK